MLPARVKLAIVSDSTLGLLAYALPELFAGLTSERDAIVPIAGDLRAIRCSVRSRDDESEPEGMPSLAHRSAGS